MFRGSEKKMSLEKKRKMNLKDKGKIGKKKEQICLEEGRKRINMFRGREKKNKYV